VEGFQARRYEALMELDVLSTLSQRIECVDLWRVVVGYVMCWLAANVGRSCARCKTLLHIRLLIEASTYSVEN
jgi:hypothetical protein